MVGATAESGSVVWHREIGDIEGKGFVDRLL